MSIILVIVFACLMLSVSFQDKADEPRLFGAVYMTRNNPFFDVLHEAIEEVVESNGDILISRDSCQNQDKQNEQILKLIEEGIEVLFLNPVDWERVQPALEACKEAGVIVVNVDTAVKDMDYVVSFIETDNYKAGVLCAEEMMRQVDSAKIVVLDNPAQTSMLDRVEGFEDTIAGNKNYEIVHYADCQGEIEIAADVMAEFLQKDIEFNVVLGGNDPSALGALAAMQQYNRDEGVLIYGIDGSPDFKAMLELGYVTGTSIQSPKSLGRVAGKTAYRYLNGEEVEKYISIEPKMVTIDNLSDYEIKGWQ